MASSDSTSSSIPKWRQNSKNYGGAALYKYKSKYIAKYFRNTLLSCKLTAKKTFDNNSSPSELNIVSNFHT